MQYISAIHNCIFFKIKMGTFRSCRRYLLELSELPSVPTLQALIH
uniref:Uncharacterized protein n=1 Tax=Bacteriophage sp. TaxID=38018 RepID=A0A8D9PGV4_9VIRU|nr:MAG TPA: hypothetical protein [Bacteriophage sp.]